MGAMQIETGAVVRRRGRPKVRTPDETRALVLAAAERTFLSRGFRSASVEMLAREAGVSKRTIYELFETKEEVLAALIRSRRNDLHWLIDAKPERSAEDVEATLRRFLRSLARLVLTGGYVGLYRLMMAEASSYPELARTFYREGTARTISTLSAWLERQRANGLLVFDDPHQTAGMLAAMTIAEPLRLLAFNLVEPCSDAQAEAYADQALHLFLNGCRAVRSKGHPR